MYTIITNQDEIKDCQQQLVNVLTLHLPNNDIYKIGFPGGNWDCNIRYNTKIWFYTYVIDSDESTSPRFWNGFGLTETLNESKSNNIITEINIPSNGLNKRVSGFFARDENNQVNLFHRGRLGGGRKGIGKNAFLNWSANSLRKVKTEKYDDYAILVGKINGNDFIDKVFELLTDISNFKYYITAAPDEDSVFLSDEELIDKIDNPTQKLNKSEITTYDRNYYIKEHALRKAKGICQLCDQKAPFKTKYGRPYLEVHHIVWLSKGGFDSPENVTALCPNCHRRMHILDNQCDIDKLVSKNA